MKATTNFFDLLGQLDVLMNSVGSNDRVRAFLKLISTSETSARYAFARLERPDWLVPLQEANAFSYLPKKAPNGDEICQLWPQVEYLKRMAKLGDRKVQERVLRIILGVNCSNNYLVRDDFCEVALAMPADLSAQWAENEVQWLKREKQIRGNRVEKYGEIISKLAKQGKSGIALNLAAEMLAVFPDPEAETKRNPKTEFESIAFSSLEPTIRCDRYNFEEFLKKHIPDLCSAAPFETLDLLCTLLDKMIAFSLKDGETVKPYDFTYIHRPAIEEHAQNHGYKVSDPLITAVRDTVDEICKLNPDKIGDVVQKVESHGWDIFVRIVLYLLRVVDNPPSALVKTYLVDENVFNRIGVHHEYFHLIKARFGELQPEDQSRILVWIEHAADQKNYLSKYEGEFTEEQKTQRLEYWQYKNLVPIQAYLTDEWKHRYDALKIKFEPLDIPADFHAYSGGGFVKPESPEPQENLADKPIDELIEYLNSWKPTGDWQAPTSEGLGSVLGALVKKQPDRYASEITRFMDAGIDPTYIEHVISGFCSALEDGKPIPFEQVFKLCRWVVDQEASTPIHRLFFSEQLRDGQGVDRNWRNAKLDTARFIEKALNEKSALTFELRDTVWKIIQPLTDDPEPDVEYEMKYGGNNIDPLSLSLNTVRGQALHAVMYYAMWVYRNIEKDVKAKDNRTPSFKDMPEVVEVLERHLNPNVDLSQTSRAVYGQWLTQLVHLGPDWVTLNVPRLFPTEQELKPLRDAAWNTYLIYAGNGTLYSRVTQTLKDIYHEEVLNLAGKQIDDKSYGSPETRLSEHVVIMYLWGEYGVEADSLIDLFFRSAPLKLTAHVLDFIGRDTRDGKPRKVVLIERMKALWDWRVMQVGGPDTMAKEELSAFGWWFASGQFDDVWAFKQLEETLMRTGISHSNGQVFERMSAVFQKYPNESLRCLRLFIEQNEEPWFFRSAHKRKGVWTILEQGMVSETDGVRDKSEVIVHLLGSKGYLEYRELLEKRPPEKN